MSSTVLDIPVNDEFRAMLKERNYPDFTKPETHDTEEVFGDDMSLWPDLDSPKWQSFMSRMRRMSPRQMEQHRVRRSTISNHVTEWPNISIKTA